MIPKKAAALIGPGKLKGKLKGKPGGKPVGKPVGPGGPAVPSGAPQSQPLKAGASKKLKGLS